MGKFLKIFGFLLIVIGALMIGFMDYTPFDGNTWILPRVEISWFSGVATWMGMSVLVFSNKVLGLCLAAVGWFVFRHL